MAKHLKNKVFILSQPKAGTYLMANILMELGYRCGNIDNLHGIKHCSRGKVEIYPLPVQPGFERSRTHPEDFRLWMGFKRTAETINKGEFAVGHLLPHIGGSSGTLRDYKKILLTRNEKDISDSLYRWDKFSGRSPSNKKDVLQHAKLMWSWTQEHKVFHITFEEMMSSDIGKLDALQEYLDVQDIKDSKQIYEQAKIKDSVTKVK